MVSKWKCKLKYRSNCPSSDRFGISRSNCEVKIFNTSVKIFIIYSSFWSALPHQCLWEGLCPAASWGVSGVAPGVLSPPAEADARGELRHRHQGGVRHGPGVRPRHPVQGCHRHSLWRNSDERKLWKQAGFFFTIWINWGLITIS